MQGVKEWLLLVAPIIVLMLLSSIAAIFQENTPEDPMLSMGDITIMLFGAGVGALLQVAWTIYYMKNDKF